MKKMTEENVKAALAGESQAHIKYLAFADKAAAENLPNVARAFKANAYAEQVHATNNLSAAVGGENFEVEEMYPAYIAVAQAQGEKTPEMFFNWALAAEKVHAGVYREAHAAVGTGRDIDFKPVHVCPVCGFTMEGEAPDKCPVCGTPKDKFVTF
jgi:rubrerythrin